MKVRTRARTAYSLLFSTLLLLRCLLRLRSGAPQVVASTELDLPVMLVLHAPVQLAFGERLTAENELVPAVFIRGAPRWVRVALRINHATRQVTLGHNAPAVAVQPGLCAHGKECKEQRNRSHGGL